MLADFMPELGLFCLIMSLGFSICLTLSPAIKQYGTRFSLGQMAFVSFSFMALAWAFYTDDFSVMYVAHNSNANLPTPYKLSAIWGGHEGSMLLWYFILCLWTCLFALNVKSSEIKSWALMVLGLLAVGINLFILMTSSPFARYLPEVPIEGADLNPLLQDFGLIVHPPILYLGYVGFAIPFALSIAALLTPNSSSIFAKIMRPWVLAAWIFLTLGIALGSWWAYYELGWGGWWFWDPVENASFMPWLSGLALLHMVKSTSKTESLAKWTLFLALVCFSLSLLGTFLVRSGVLTSVHAFASDPSRGQFILKLLALTVGGSALVYSFKAGVLAKKNISLFSREGFIFIGSVMLFVSMASILLGTLYPIIMDSLLDTKLSVGAPYFNAIFIPFVALVLFVMGLAPHIKWLKDEPRHTVKLIVGWLLISFGLSVILPLIFKWPFNIKLIFGLFLSVWIFVTTMALVLKRYKNHNLLNLSFISMAIAHLGVAMCVAGVSLTTQLDVEKDIAMRVGDKVRVGDYQFYLKNLKEVIGPNYQGVQAEMQVGSLKLYPEKRLYMPREMPISETAIDPGFFRDLYVALGEPLGEETWSVRIYVKPFVRWIWLGALLMALGGFCAVARGNK